MTDIIKSRDSKITIGLTGNPNTGKSTLFNLLTGAKQHVGNWPGKTVDKKTGSFIYNSTKINLVDLPGSYSLTAFTEEESITAEFILEDNPDVVVQVLDAQNLERNLFVTIQLIELQAPLILALNMADLAKQEGIKINTEALSTLLNIPVVIINAKKKKGINKLLDTILKESKSHNVSKIKLTYGTEVTDELQNIKTFITTHEKKITHKDLNWIALKLLEGDIRAEQKLTQKHYYLELKSLVTKSIDHLEKVFNQNIHSILSNTRYGFIKGLSREVITRDKHVKQSISDKADKLLTSKYLGIPSFMIISWLMFQATFTLSTPLISLIEVALSFASEKTLTLLTSWHLPTWSISLIVDGVIGGVGGVLVFIPIIGILFAIMAVLEDSGYMSRIAYVMDNLMHKIGLHGKAFIPMILGFGCNVPAIMATRTLETKKDRLLAILINPFMSCSARLPVYVLFVGAFFTAYQGWVISSLYFLGLIIAIIIGLVFKKVFSNNLSSPFVIELPPYRWPALSGIAIHAWENIWAFIKKGGTIILAFSVISWSLATFPLGVKYASRESLAGQIGETISPVFEPLGFGNWQSSVSLIFGSAAKEVIVGTFGTLYNIEDIEKDTGTSSLTNALQDDFTPLSAYSFMVFVLLYVPCVAVLATVKKEMGSWKWPIFMVGYTTGIAWILSFIIYQGGLLLGYG